MRGDLTVFTPYLRLVSVSTINGFEFGRTVERGALTQDAIIAAFEGAGVLAIPENGSGRKVCHPLRPSPKPAMRDFSAVRLYVMKRHASNSPIPIAPAG